MWVQFLLNPHLLSSDSYTTNIRCGLSDTASIFIGNNLSKDNFSSLEPHECGVRGEGGTFVENQEESIRDRRERRVGWGFSVEQSQSEAGLEGAGRVGEVTAQWR